MNKEDEINEHVVKIFQTASDLFNNSGMMELESKFVKCCSPKSSHMVSDVAHLQVLVEEIWRLLIVKDAPKWKESPTDGGKM